MRGFYKRSIGSPLPPRRSSPERVKPFFPGVSDSVLQASITRYKSLEIWPDSPAIGIDGYNAMRQVLIDGGLVKGRHPYERLVRSEFAEQAMAE